MFTNEMETIAGHLKFANTIRVAKEDGESKIVWSSNAIIQGLGDTDTLKINSTSTTRGSIYDRNGKLLAGEGKVSSVGLVPGKMNKESAEDKGKIAELLNISVEAIDKLLSASYVKEDTFVKISEIPTDDKELERDLLKIKGIKISTSSGRVYPYGEVTSHLVGYVQKVTPDEIEQNHGKGYSLSSVIRKNWNRESI